jgi:hypothetical protein
MNGLEDLKRVPGYERKNFSDCEIISITLDRRVPSATFVILLVPERDETGESRSKQLSLQFVHVEKLRLESFNHQNVISSLRCEEGLEESEYSSTVEQRIKITIDTHFGAWSTFTCSGIKVLSLSESTLRTGDPRGVLTDSDYPV